jgi:hypothetical protein
MATLSKSSFNDATIGVAFSDSITVVMEICAGTTIETFVSATMTAVTPSLATGIEPGLCPGFPVGSLTYIPTATPSNSPVLSINGTFNETYFDQREWEYRDDTTGDAAHIPIIELQSTQSDPAGRIYNVTKDSVQEPYASGGQFEDEIPNPCDTLIRYKPDFRSQRVVTYTYTVNLLCAGVPFTQVFNINQTILNNWDLGRDKVQDIMANKIRYGT